MIASWVAVIVLFVIQGLNLHEDLTIKPHTLGLLYIIVAIVIAVDAFFNRPWVK